MPEDKPPRFPAGKNPSRPRPVKQPAFPQPLRNGRGNFNLGGRRFNGQTVRRGSRH
jgi:hypothetical protein